MENSIVVTVLQNLSSTKIKERSNAVDELTTLLKDAPHKLGTKYLSNTATTLLEILDYEHRNYCNLLSNFSDSTGNKKSLIENRLTSISYLLRLFIEKTACRFKFKTVKLFLNALPELMIQENSKNLMEPISIDLSFSLLSLIESEVFKLNYTEEQWITIVSTIAEYVENHIKINANDRNISNLISILCCLLSMDTVGVNHIISDSKIIYITIALLEEFETENTLTKIVIELAILLITKTQFVAIEENINLVYSAWKYFTKINWITNEDTSNRYRLLDILASDLLTANRHILEKIKDGNFFNSFVFSFREYIIKKIQQHEFSTPSVDQFLFDCTFSDSKKSVSWFAFSNFQLNPNSKEYFKWIDSYSMIKLIKCYFSITPSSDNENNLLKKRKLNPTALDIISNSISTNDFLINYLIADSPEYQAHALQLLPFYLETAKISCQECELFLGEVIIKLNNPNMFSWASLSLICLISTIGKSISISHFDKIMLLTIPKIKEDNVFKIACILLARCIQYYPEGNINERILTHLTEIYEYSELKGPYLACEEAYILWGALERFGCKFKFKEGETSLVKIVKWFQIKNRLSWKQSENNKMEYRKNNIFIFLKWLAGENVKYLNRFDYEDSYFTGKMEFWEAVHEVWSLTSSPRNFSEVIKTTEESSESILARIVFNLEQPDTTFMNNYFLSFLSTFDAAESVTIKFLWLCQIGKYIGSELKDVFLQEKSSFFVSSFEELVNSSSFENTIDLSIIFTNFVDLIDNLKDSWLLSKFPAKKLIEKFFSENNTFILCINHSTSNANNENSNFFKQESNKSIQNELRIKKDLGIIFHLIGMYCRSDWNITENVSNVDFLLTTLRSIKIEYVISILPEVYSTLSFNLTLTQTQLRTISDCIANALLSSKYSSSCLGMELLADYLGSIQNIWLDSSESDFNGDCNDMFTWLLSRVSENSFSGINSYISLSNLLLDLLQYHDLSKGVAKSKKQDIFSILTKCFQKLGPVYLLKIILKVKGYISSVSIKNQKILFKEIMMIYDDRSAVKTNSFLKCFIISELSNVSSTMLIDSILHLQGVVDPDLAIEYNRLTIKHIVNNLGLSNGVQLFERCKYDLIDQWIEKTPNGCGFDLQIWRYHLFYEWSVSNFIANYSVEITALIYTKKIINETLLSNLKSIANQQFQILLKKSLPYCIIFAFTKTGTGSIIYKRLETHFGSQLDKMIHSQELLLFKLFLQFIDLGSLAETHFFFQNYFKNTNLVAELLKPEKHSVKYQHPFHTNLKTSLTFINDLNLLRNINSNDLHTIILWILSDLDISFSLIDTTKSIRQLLVVLLLCQNIELLDKTIGYLLKQLSSYLKGDKLITEVMPALQYLLGYSAKRQYNMTTLLIPLLTNIILSVNEHPDNGKNLIALLPNIKKCKSELLKLNVLCLELLSTSHNETYDNAKVFLQLATYGEDGITLLSLLSQRIKLKIKDSNDLSFSILDKLVTTSIPAQYRTNEFQILLADIIELSWNMDKRLTIRSTSGFMDSNYQILFDDLGSLSPFYSQYFEYYEFHSTKMTKNNLLLAELITNVLLRHYQESENESWKISRTLYNKFIPNLGQIDQSYFPYINLQSTEKIQQNLFLTKDFLSLEIEYDHWLKGFIKHLLTKISLYVPHMKVFEYFCLEETKFAELVLPTLFNLVIYLDAREGTKDAIYILSSISKVSKGNEAEKKLNILFELIKLIRTGKILKERFSSNIYLQLNLISIYEIAEEFNYFTFAYMIYEEFFCNSQESLDFLKLQSIYSSIGDPDFMSAIPVQTTLSGVLSSLHQKKKHEVNLSLEKIIYDNAKADLDIVMKRANNTELLSNCLDNNFFGLASAINENMDVTYNSSSYKWALELGNWNLPDVKEIDSKDTALYHTLKNMFQRPFGELDKVLDRSILKLLDSKTNFKSLPIWLDTIQELSFWKKIIHSFDNCSISNQNKFNNDIYLDSLQHIQRIDLIRFTGCEFSSFKSNIISRYHLTRMIEFNEVGLEYQVNKHKALLSIIFLSNLVKGSITKNIPQEAIKSSFLLEDIIKRTDNIAFPLVNSARYYIATSMWCLDKTKTPIESLKKILSSADNSQNLYWDTYAEHYDIPKERIKASLVKWTSESRYEKADDIFENYIKDINISIKDSKTKSEIFYIFGEFFNKQVQNLIKSNEVDNLRNKCSVSMTELQTLKAIYANESLLDAERKDAKKHYNKTHIQYEREKQQLSELEEREEKFIIRALSYYINVLVFTNHYDYDVIDKFCSLWFQYDKDAKLNLFLYKEICTVPSYKFLPWVNQIASKLSLDDSQFQKTLQILLKRLLYKLPYDSLYAVMSILMYRSQPENMDETIALKLGAVENILKELQTFEKGEYYKLYVAPVLEFCEKSIELANVKFVKNTRHINLENINIGKYWLNHLPSLKLPLPTIKVSITSSMNGKEIRPYIISIKGIVDISTTGISLPKIVTIYISDGSKQKILLKGSNDDLRQDSIMEQIFKQVNKIIENDPSLKTNNLKIRTYEVLPLGPSAGIIEYVSNSVSLHQVLTTLHKDDSIKFDQARKMMKAVQNKSKAEKLATYQKLTSSIKPQFRNFFFNNFTNPQNWLEAKKRYAKGTAVISIVGYILGLGDRHLNNILIDQITGEPVHIDLGIAFDQGRLLPVPELVPFRLTRDIIDGFGVTGVEGIFRKNCEHVYHLLRNDFDKVLHVLNILKWDPLYSWVMSPVHKHRHLFDEDSQLNNYKLKSKKELSNEMNDNNESYRAIQSVETKLVGSGLSIEATVQEVIQEATDPNNLSNIYMGWTPFY